MRIHRFALVAVALSALATISGCATRTAPAPGGAPAARIERPLSTKLGLASYYGREFQGRRTASGQRFDMRALVAAHPSYPFGTRVRVTNLRNDRQIVLTIVDRGPAEAHQSRGVIIDISQGAAERLAFVREGRARVRVEVLAWGGK